MRRGGARQRVYEDRYRCDCSARAIVGGPPFQAPRGGVPESFALLASSPATCFAVCLGTSSPSLQSDPSRQGEPLTFHIWFRVPLPEILWMHPALHSDAYTVLTNQAEPSRQAGAFGATKFKALSNFLDGESVYHSLDVTQTGVSTTSQEGGCWPPFRGVTSAITEAIRLASCGAIPCSGGPYSPNRGRACVCRPRLNQSGFRPGGGPRQKGEG